MPTQIVLHFRYIIDVGCGNADKVSVLAKEFLVIGFDRNHNIEKAKTFHPEILYNEVNLDVGSNCVVTIPPPHILMQSIILSADVIEHIVDPKYCYFPVLKYFMNFAPALVMSTPQRGMYLGNISQKVYFQIYPA